jgi:hypothetical protein
MNDDLRRVLDAGHLVAGQPLRPRRALIVREFFVSALPMPIDAALDLAGASGRSRDRVMRGPTLSTFIVSVSASTSAACGMRRPRRALTQRLRLWCGVFVNQFGGAAFGFHPLDFKWLTYH